MTEEKKKKNETSLDFRMPEWERLSQVQCLKIMPFVHTLVHTDSIDLFVHTLVHTDSIAL